MCGTCSAPIVWALTPTGKRSPVDEPLDGEKGNVLLTRPAWLGQPLATTLAGATLELARQRGVPLHLNHWATCPDKAEWRERQAAKRARAAA